MEERRFRLGMNKDFLCYALKIYKNDARFCFAYSCFLGFRDSFLFLNRFVTLESIFISTVFLSLCLKKDSSIFFFCKHNSVFCVYKAIALQSNNRLAVDLSHIKTKLNFDSSLFFSSSSKKLLGIDKYFFDNCIPVISFINDRFMPHQLCFPLFSNNNSVKMHFYFCFYLKSILIKNYLISGCNIS